MKDVKKKRMEEGERGGRENKRGSDRNTQIYQRRVKVERERVTQDYLGNPKVNLSASYKQSSLLINEEADVQEEIEDGREFQRAIAEGRKDRNR